MRQLLACNRGVITSQKWSHNFSQASFDSQNRRSASISVGYATAQYATRRLLACFTEELKVLVHLLSSISDDWTRNWGPQPCHSASAHFRHWILTPNPWQRWRSPNKRQQLGTVRIEYFALFPATTILKYRHVSTFIPNSKKVRHRKEWRTL